MLHFIVRGPAMKPIYTNINKDRITFQTTLLEVIHI